MKKLKLGFIGAGFMAQIAHLPSYYEDSRVKISALSETNQRLLSKVSKKYQIKKTYISYKKMLSEEKLDAVVLLVNRSKIENIARYVLKKRYLYFLRSQWL